LGVANHRDGSILDLYSKIYKWNGSIFEEIQAIQTYGAMDFESFTINGDTYLAVANQRTELTLEIDSIIYRWNGVLFEAFQAIPTQGASDWESFNISGEMYLAVANECNDATCKIFTKIYKWDGTGFEEVQAILSDEAIVTESFKISGDTYLAIANWSDEAIPTVNIFSKLYKWNGRAFVAIQSILTNGAVNWKSFKISGETYLAVANQQDDIPNPNIDSKIYKWSGTSSQRQALTGPMIPIGWDLLDQNAPGMASTVMLLIMSLRSI